MPSEHDNVLTRAIVLVTKMVHPRVLDQFNLSTQEAFSFRRAGLL